MDRPVVILFVSVCHVCAKRKKEICIAFQILCGFLALACFPYTSVGLGGYTFLTINKSFADMSDQRTTENSNRKPMLLFLQNSIF